MSREASARRYLIVNADDFGASAGVNRGIVETHQHGIVTSTSLLVDAPGSEDAGRLARLHAGLSVGLHVELSAVLAGVGEPALLAAELERQATRFLELVGAPPTHVDSHRDVHRAPDLAPAFLELAGRLGVSLRGHSPIRRLGDFYGQWGGESHPEQLSVSSLVRMLETRLDDHFTELICHPGYADDQLRSSYVRERELEVATLCDVRLREALSRLGIEPIGHRDVERAIARRT